MGKTKSCGCINRAIIADRNRKGIKYSNRDDAEHKRLYRIYYGMKTRCNNPKERNYHRYGGRGIHVCPEWQNNFDAFKSWALTHGYSPNLSIDRINNDGNYEPDNCRWATAKEQANNRSTNKKEKKK